MSENGNTEYTEMKLYCPLVGTFYENPYENPYGEYVEDWDGYEVDGSFLADHQEIIEAEIEKIKLPEESERGLMVYYRDNPDIERKIHSAKMAVEEHHGKLWGVMVCELKEPLTRIELAEFTCWTLGNFSDGIGESFEQRTLAVDDGTLNVHFWNSSKEYFICTQQEFERLHRPRPKIPQRHTTGKDER